jgi:TonB family protein
MAPCRARILLATLLLGSCTPAPKPKEQSNLPKKAEEPSTTRLPDQQRSSNCDFKSYKPVQLSDWLPGGILKRVKPVYPTEALRRGIHGRVLVRVLVNKNGDVERVCSIGDPLLAVAAESAALQWRFRRPTFNGRKDLLGYIKETLVFDFVPER